MKTRSEATEEEFPKGKILELVSKEVMFQISLTTYIRARSWLGSFYVISNMVSYAPV